MNRHDEIIEMMGTNPNAVADMLVSWETELSKVMPLDFKDWWQNSKTEWPIVARLVIDGLREREELAWRMLSDVKGMAREALPSPHCSSPFSSPKKKISE